SVRANSTTHRRCMTTSRHRRGWTPRSAWCRWWMRATSSSPVSVRSGGPMRYGMAAVAVTAAVALAGCGEAGGAEARASQAERVRTVNVEVLEVLPRDFTNVVRIVGTVEAERDVVVS